MHSDISKIKKYVRKSDFVLLSELVLFLSVFKKNVIIVIFENQKHTVLQTLLSWTVVQNI